MSDPAIVTSDPPAIDLPAPGTQTAPAAPPPAAPSPAVVQMTSEQLTARLHEERAKGAKDLLTQLGLATPDEAKQTIAASKAIAEQLAALQPVTARAALLETTVREMADAQLATLPEAQRNAVIAIAGDDASKRLQTLNTLRTAGAFATSAPAPAPLPAPVTTMPAGNGAPPTAPTGQPNHLAIWEEQKATHPVAAAHYYLSHKREIDAARQSRTK